MPTVCLFDGTTDHQQSGYQVFAAQVEWRLKLVTTTASHHQNEVWLNCYQPRRQSFRK
jgi:hypothetical protein